MRMEDNGGIPEELRCKRSDGKQWRCNALSMPDKTVCEKHYYQAKKRAANSAMRASLKKARRGYLDDSYSHDNRISSLKDPLAKNNEKPGSLSSSKARGFKRHGSEDEQVDVDDDKVKIRLSSPPRKGFRSSTGSGAWEYEYSGRSSDSSGDIKRLSCHQCQRNDRTVIVRCLNCNRRGYCSFCIARWYSDIPIEDVQRVCPACRNICSCRMCMRGDSLIKIRVQEMPALEKLRYLHRLLTFVLPMLKQIHSEQSFEIAIESPVTGIKSDIPRAKINADEQMCCDLCKIPIFDYHRHCTNCMYDVCLSCCRDLRRASKVGFQGESPDLQNGVKSKGLVTSTAQLEPSSDCSMADVNALDLSHLYPKWKANKDGSIPCPSKEVNGCGSSNLVLRRILKINWVSKLVKNAEEMVNGCKVTDAEDSEACSFCLSAASKLVGSMDGKIRSSSYRDNSKDNLVYCPNAEDLKLKGVDHFHKHWVKGEVIIVKNAFAPSLASSWDPMNLWKGIQEMADGGVKDSIIIKATNCLDQAEFDIQLEQFIKGYYDGSEHEDGWPKLLKLKDWPPPSVLEEFLLCHRPEFLSNLPLLEFIHSKWGLLNLAAKLPPDSLQTEVGPQIFISYGMREELGRGDSVSNLQVNMSDQVYLLMHTSKVEKIVRSCEEIPAKTIDGNGHITNNNDADHGTMLTREDGATKVQTNGDLNQASREAHAGAVWDVFRRQDVGKLNEYLRTHQQEFVHGCSRPFALVTWPIYEQAFYLNNHQKRKLKEEYGIEPWEFKQHVGEAVFIPAGCPFQVRNIQSSVQLGFDFLLPESLHESVRLAQEIRCLPNDHDAKLKMLEVGKISLYAASWAIREIQKMIMEPNRLSSEISFDDRNLTAMVCQNLEKMTKWRQIIST